MEKDVSSEQVEYEALITIGASAEPQADTPSRLDNVLTLGLVALLALTVIIAVIRKAVSNRKPAPVVVEEIPAMPSVEAPGSAGNMKLYDTDPKTAAMLMAIVADKLQKPLNELRFISIKEVE